MLLCYLLILVMLLILLLQVETLKIKKPLFYVMIMLLVMLNQFSLSSHKTYGSGSYNVENTGLITTTPHSHNQSITIKKFSSQDDCCHLNEGCTMSSCVAFLSTPDFNYQSSEMINQKITESAIFLETFINPSLYRPPITA